MSVIAPSDILLRYSTTAGAAGNTTAGTAAGSLGKYVSTTSPTDLAANNWFDDISAAENLALVVDYRLIFVLNNHASVTWTGVRVWIAAVATGGAALAISLDTTGVTAKGSGSAQAKTIVNETTAPATQSFTAPTTFGTGLVIGDIPAGSVAPVWIRRTATASGALASDAVALGFQGGT